VTKLLNTHYGLDTSVMSDVETAWEGKDVPTGPVERPDFEGFDVSELGGARDRLERVRLVIVKDLGYEDGDVSLRDAAIVRWACSLVAKRAATLSGVAVAAVLLQTGRAVLAGPDGSFKSIGNLEEHIKVGVDGSLIEFYPHFERTLRDSLRILVGKDVEKRVDIGMAKDGSGVGAALCALQATKQL